MQNWDDLRVFLAVARQESLSAAARVLRVDPATVGRRIQRLEEAIGATLFLKSPQGYALTREGEALLPGAVAAEKAITGASPGPGEDDGSLTGQIRIGAPDGCANYLLPQVAATLGRAHPGLDLQIVAQPRIFNLSKREADMAIGVSHPQNDRLHVEKLCDYRLHFFAHAQYLDTHGRPQSLADLRHHRIIGYIPDMIFDPELDYLTGFQVPRLAVGSNSASVQAQLVAAGGGLAICHDFAMAGRDGVEPVLVDQVSLTRSFYLVRHADEMRTPRLNRFAVELAEAFRREVRRLERRP